MCNFLGYKVTKNQQIKLLSIEKELGTEVALAILRSGFEYKDWIILRQNDTIGDMECVPAHWEFIPPWIKSMEALQAARKQGIPWLNATAEKLPESKMFRDAALKRRCLVPVSCFYEWRHFALPEEKKPKAYPYYITLKNKPYFFMAGIWQNWTDRLTGETMDCFAIVTTEANAFMSQIHNTKKRMPVIFTDELAYQWIQPELSEEQIFSLAKYQIPPEMMEAYTISKDFRIAEDPTEPYQYEFLPTLQ